MNKIIRTLCYFSDTPDPDLPDRLEVLSKQLTGEGFLVQTQRLVTRGIPVSSLQEAFGGRGLFLGGGTLDRSSLFSQAAEFMEAEDVSVNLAVHDVVTHDDILFLLDLCRHKPEKTFQFSFTFNNAEASPYFPAAHSSSNGFSVGLQPTDLSAGCSGLNEWMHRMKEVWHQLLYIFKDDPDFLGIDTSIAPMYDGDSSFINIINKTHTTFSEAVTSDTFVDLSRFLKEENPLPVGLCGLMFPCLEDYELARQYEAGQFTIERNIFLSLHSGLGIDTYPVGIDEDSDRIRQVLNLLLALSNKYKKPLAARFVSDGVSRIGDRSNFKNPYLQDVVIRPL